MKKRIFVLLLILLAIALILNYLMLDNEITKYSVEGKKCETKSTITFDSTSTEKDMEISNEQQAVIDVANAFYYRGASLQYDKNPITYQNANTTVKYRGDFTISPEDCTPQSIYYSTCADYTWNIFYEAFENGRGEKYELTGNGKKASGTSIQIQLANKNSDYYNENVAVDYIYGKRGEIKAKFNEYKDRIKNELKPGDIIVYRRENLDKTRNGHSMIYLGNDLVLDSASEKSLNTYNFAEKADYYEDNGTIRINSLEEDFLITKSGRLFAENVIQIGILRPINEISSNPTSDSDYRISKKTLNRMKYNKLVSMKTSSINKYDSVNPGDKITYTITLENKSDIEDYKNIVVTDNVPENTELIELTGNGANANGNLSWNVDIPHGRTVTISYTVRVLKNKTTLGTTIVNDSTIVAGIPLNSIETTVNTTLTTEEKEKLSNLVLSKIGSKFKTTEDFINSIYTNVKFPSAQELLSIIFSSEQVTMMVTNETNSAAIRQTGDTGKKEVFKLKDLKDVKDDEKVFRNMYIKGLFGGLYTIGDNEPTNNDGRNKVYSANTLSVGDIVVLYDDDFETDTYVAGEKNMYLYLGDNTFATVLNEELILINGDDGVRLIDSLLGQNCFIILRPSYALEKPSMPGDINENDQIDTNDILQILRHIAAEKTGIHEEWLLEDKKLELADINQNGKVDTNDVLKLKRYIAASKSESIKEKHPDWLEL